MSAVTPKIELELAGRGSGWTEITSDVLSPIRIGYGIRGAGPTDRTASAGSCTFTLNNSETNSARTLGYYSIGGASSRAGFTLGIRVRVQFRDPATSTWHVKFVGAITSITVTPGRYRSRTVQVIATDWIDEAARSTIAGLVTQTNKRSDEIVTLLINNVARGPVSTSIATGASTFPYALDTARDDRPNPVLQELARVTLSELGFFYVKGDGTAVFESRFDRLNLANQATFSDTMTGLNVTSSRDDLLSKVQVVAHPRTADTVPQVLYRLQSVPSLGVLEDITAVCGYSDPNNRASRVGGTAMVTPVPYTDYTANSKADGTGTDLTMDLGITATFSSNSARVTAVNYSLSRSHITKFQLRGIGLYDYENAVAEAENTQVATTFGEQTVTVDMPYSSDLALSSSAARYLLGLYGSESVGIWFLGTAGSSELGITTQLPYSVRRSVGSVSVAPATAALQTQILAREVGDRISISESVTGINKPFYINAVDLEVTAPGLPFVTWLLAPADTTGYWRLGTASFSNLGESTRLAYT